MKKTILFILFPGLLLGMYACHNQAASSQEMEKVAYKDFLEKFPSFSLPYQCNKDSLSVEFPDSAKLENSEDHQFIPDSIWHPEGEKKEAKVFPVGQNSYGDLHLFLVKSVTSGATRIALLIFGKTDTLVSAKMVASINDRHQGHISSFRLDDEYLLHINKRKERSDGHVITRENIYGIDPEGKLNLILTNTNEPVSAGAFYNPIDTFPQKNKNSGDYTSGKYNLVSIRDGEKEGTFHFFIHLNKHNGDCRGELDGVAKFTGKDVAEYKDEDGLCAIRFTFTSQKVTIKEIGGCGAYRGISCFFDGTYTKK